MVDCKQNNCEVISLFMFPFKRGYIMVRQPSRQIHLDFHIGTHSVSVHASIRKILKSLAIRQGAIHQCFRQMPSRVVLLSCKNGKMHPTLNFDLTSMMEAAHEIGVKHSLYITVGWSANDAKEHPEWIVRHKDGTQLFRQVNLTQSPRKASPTFHGIFVPTADTTK